MTRPGADPLTETALTSEPVFDGKLLKVHRDRVRLPDGGEGVREYIRHPGAVLIVAQRPDGRLLLVRQFRYALGRAVLEMPAGRIEPQEDLLDCARRELIEETGYAAGEWRHLGTIHPCVGYSDERIEVFLARSLTEVGARPDDDEFLEPLSLGVGEVEAAARDGRITDAKTLCALFLALPLLRPAVPPDAPAA
jgi:ADP-ribose pyrophosphatase